jgi:hypothetical protein|tara:strand:+ start:8185 stop:8385 length:201 start_codon:yes stop_codon:yes gene_type:complete
MDTTEKFLKEVVIDLCTRTFLLISDDGEEKIVECETTDQFMNVLEVCTSKLSPEEIVYAEVATTKE